MSELQIDNTSEIVVSSSLKNARWQGRAEPNGFERWYFDALSDDGREALAIAFYDNYPFSPRYFDQQKNTNGKTLESERKFPAVSFTYSLDGKVILDAVNEFGSDAFSVFADDCGCSIGRSTFRVESASYGSGFIIHLDVLTTRKRRIIGELEWLSIESDLREADDEGDESITSWNIVAPRSDVSGRISLVGRRGDARRTVHFRGTGYHDHLRRSSSLIDTAGSRFWGRAHFVDSTTIFHHHESEKLVCSKLFLVRDGKLHERDVPGMEDLFRRSHYGLKLPERVSFLTSDNIRLRIKPIKSIQSGFFERKLLSEMTLMLRDGKPRKALGITEIVTPARMQKRLFRWIEDMRIGKDGKGPML